MKKVPMVVLIAATFATSNFSYAQDHEEAPRHTQGEFEGQKQMLGKMGGMMQDHTKLVATSDGGIVVLQGPRMAKYDTQLNLVNEVELKPAGPKPGAKRAETAPTEGSASEPGPQGMTDQEVAEILGQVVPEA